MYHDGHGEDSCDTVRRHIRKERDMAPSFSWMILRPFNMENSILWKYFQRVSTIHKAGMDS